MSIQGLRDTSGFVANQRPKNWREGIMLLQPNGMAPLFAMTSMLKSKSTDDPEFNWWTKTMPSQRLALATTHTAAVTTLTVSADALTLKEGDLLLLEESNEIVIVTSDPSSDTAIPVQRAYTGTATAAAITATGAGVNPNLFVIGSAFEEGSPAPTGINYDPVKVYNYTQIFRNTLEATRTALKTRLRTGDALKEAKREAFEDHQQAIEKALFFGTRTETTRNGKPLRTTGGAIEYIDSTNVVNNAGTAVDMETLEGWLERMFRWGSQEKVCFLGNTALLTLNQIIRKNSTWNIQSGIKEFGMAVTRLSCPFGELVCKTHPLFNRLLGGTTGTADYTARNSWMVVLDMAELVYRPLKDSDTKFQNDMQDRGVDGLKAGYLTEMGLEIHHPLSHFLIKGVSSAAADS